MLRTRLYAEIDRLEAKVKILEDDPPITLRKLAIVAAYVEHGPMTKADFEQLLAKT